MLQTAGLPSPPSTLNADYDSLTREEKLGKFFPYIKRPDALVLNGWMAPVQFDWEALGPMLSSLESSEQAKHPSTADKVDCQSNTGRLHSMLISEITVQECRRVLH